MFATHSAGLNLKSEHEPAPENEQVIDFNCRAVEVHENEKGQGEDGVRDDVHLDTPDGISEEDLPKSTPISLLRSSKLLTLAVTANRVDAIDTVLSPIHPSQRSFLLEPSLDFPPFSVLHDRDIGEVTDPETGEALSTQPPEPPLLTACLAGSVEAASVLLNFGASPQCVLSLKSLKPMILKQSFGGEIVRILGNDDAERFLLFLKSGFGTRELAMVLVPGFGVGGGEKGGEEGVFEFIKTIQANECLRVFREHLTSEKEGAGGKGKYRVGRWRNVMLPPGPHNELHEVQLLESTLKGTYNDMLTEVSIVSELIKGGAKGLVENVKCIKGEMDECDVEFGREMDILEGLLERFDRHIDDEVRIDDSTSERLIGFRYTVIERNGELVSVDVTEQECKEKVENMMRFSDEASSLDIQSVMESLVEDGWKKVKEIRREIENLAQEIAHQDEGLDQTGLKGALKHYRNLRDEARLMSERNRVIRIHQQRLERELELLDVGFYDRSDRVQGNGGRRDGGVQHLGRRRNSEELGSQHALPSPVVLPPTTVIREGLDSHKEELRAQEENGPGGETIWQIILRLFLGFEFEEQEEHSGRDEKRRDLNTGEGSEGYTEVKAGDVLIL
ncbi:hypothetical protein TrCOL_g1683 [Triparma columacea]|uniref:Uncharacterized protein n=1 Tax=Triparma columacea TaxID=722753 RepID=A0A9W7LEJ9_9STRA|nr:hypothetical protein TrCOL_g1683 [Triparma columacea]